MGFALLNKTDCTTETKTIVVGLGKTGLSCVRFLVAQGESVMVVDSRQNPPGLSELKTEFPDVPCILGDFDQAFLASAASLVVSPGVSINLPEIEHAKDNGVSVLGDVELFARHAQAPVVAITGSNGKSTVTTLVYEMAKAANKNVRVGGNIGTPVLELIESTEPDLYVLELSSFQLETTDSLKLAAATVLNISQDHLDRYSGMQGYIDAKKRIFAHAKCGVLNADDEVVSTMASGISQCVKFSLSEPKTESDFGVRQQDGELWIAKGESNLLSINELKVVGMHNVANALAALALGEQVGLPLTAMLEALRQFKGLPHRCQWIASINGVDWYNDSKATNVGSAEAAIIGLDRPIVLIAGGEGKGQDFSPLKEALAKHGRGVVLIGCDADEIEKALDAVVPTVRASSMEQAVEKSAQLAQSGGAVLLAPACASFDMFSGFEDRGNQFIAAVQRMAS